MEANVVMIIVWFSLFILAALIEMNTMDLTSIWFSVGSLLAFVLAIAGAPEWLQVTVFIVTSAVLIILVRPIAKKYLKTNVINTNTDRLVGKVAVCTKRILPGERGEVKIDGKYWMAITTSEDEIEVDEKIEVLAIEGVKLVVDRIK
jgi:membrane protein implicated in regulation of membrane protease activity